MIPPIFTSTPTAYALHPPLNLQRPCGTPMLQTFPSPTPPTSLTHVGPPTLHYGLFISRDKVRDVLLMLAQLLVSTDQNFSLDFEDYNYV
ncbi:hypothetical protein Gotri_011536, partial [Gossypium trilobum]|nr:hypothetical protein [Gossypium trilobum]